MCVCMCQNQLIDLVVECSPMAWETRVQSQVESYLISPCLTPHFKVHFKVKIEQSRERSSPLSYTSV